MNRNTLEPILSKIFNEFEDKQNLSFKVVKNIYNKSNTELTKDESKLAKEIIMELYVNYMNSKENVEPIKNDIASKKRVREQSAEKNSPLNDVITFTKELISKPEGKKQRLEVSILIKITFTKITEI